MMVASDQTKGLRRSADERRLSNHPDRRYHANISDNSSPWDHPRKNEGVMAQKPK
jgi:hypothetical protein